MSNEQPSSSLFSPPVLLVVSPQTNQQVLAESFIQTTLEWTNLPNTQLTVINPENETIPIQTIRDVIGELAYASHMGKKRAYVFLHADQITTPAQHAFLKTLEEPPQQTQIILVSNQPEKLLETIRSRCITQYRTSVTTEHRVTLENLPETFRALLTNPKRESHSYDQLISLAEEYKNREQAIELLQSGILAAHQDREQFALDQFIAVEQQLLQTLNHLEANVNVNLALEHCFFSLLPIWQQTRKADFDYL